MDKIDSFAILPEEEYEIAKMLYQTGKSLNCKLTFKPRAIKNQPKGYRIHFNKRETNKVLYWMQIQGGALYVKANLFHIDDYAEKMAACPEKIKRAITSTKECDYCGLCPPRWPYHVDGIAYNPCCFHGHYFTRLDYEEWRVLNDLLISEHDHQDDPQGEPPPVPPEKIGPGKPYHGFYTK